MGAISSSLLNVDLANKSYIYASLSADQTTNISTNDHIKWNTIDNVTGSDITLDTTTSHTTSLGVTSVGRFLLKSGKTYKLTAGLTINENVTTNRFGWYDATTGVYLGKQTEIFSGTSSSTKSSIPVPTAYITTSVDTFVEIRIAANGGMVGIYGSTNGSFAIIETVEAVIPVTVSPSEKWTPFTPTFSTGFGTCTDVSMWYRRDKGDMLIRGNFTTGTVSAASVAYMSIPNGESIDLDLISSVSLTTVFGYGSRLVSTPQTLQGSAGLALTYQTALGANVLQFTYFVDGGTYQSANTSVIFNSSERVNIALVRVPIAGWS